MGWSPATFWAATPVEFAAAVDARLDTWDEEDREQEFGQFREELERAGVA